MAGAETARAGGAKAGVETAAAGATVAPTVAPTINPTDCYNGCSNAIAPMMYALMSGPRLLAVNCDIDPRGSAPKKRGTHKLIQRVLTR